MPNQTTIAPTPLDTGSNLKSVLHFYHGWDLGKFPVVYSLCRQESIAGGYKTVEKKGNPMDTCIVCAELKREPLRCPTCGHWLGVGK